jgi:hypothetical protein
MNVVMSLLWVTLSPSFCFVVEYFDIFHKDSCISLLTDRFRPSYERTMHPSCLMTCHPRRQRVREPSVSRHSFDEEMGIRIGLAYSQK